MKTKIKTKTIASLIGVSFFMLIFSALSAKAMANPASEYCVGVGGTLEIRTQRDGGQYGVCVFSDGSECEEWALYNGDCQKGLISSQREIEEKNIQNKEVVAQLKEIYERLNKIKQEKTGENVQRMVLFDESVSVEDFGIKKSGGIFQMIGTFFVPKTVQEQEANQVGILPDSKQYFCIEY